MHIVDGQCCSPCTAGPSVHIVNGQVTVQIRRFACICEMENKKRKGELGGLRYMYRCSQRGSQRDSDNG